MSLDVRESVEDVTRTLACYHAAIGARVFKHSKVGSIAGCYVTDGHIQRGSKIRLTRNGVIVTEELSIETLKRVKDDVKEVKAGFECGIKLAGYDDIKIGDILEAFERKRGRAFRCGHGDQ